MFEQEFTFLRVFWRLSVRCPESSWIICVSLSNAWLIWIINMLAKCLNFPETWQMCFLGHEMISDSIAASSLKCFAPDGQLLKPKIQVAPKILARRAKEGLQVKLIRCYGWWINIKWNVSITNLQISQSQSVEFWIQRNSTQSNDFLLPTMILQCPFSSSTRIWVSSMRWLISRCLIDRPYFSHI